MVRKLYLIAGLYAACVIGAVLSGCSIYDKEDLSKMVATSGDAECQADGAKNGEGDAEGKEKSGDKTEDAESNTDTDGESQGLQPDIDKEIFMVHSAGQKSWNEWL